MTTTWPAIGDHALLSDCHSAALVTRDGTVDWLAFPRFDSPSVLGRLLDPDAGHFGVAPVGRNETSRRYLPGSLVLETTFRNATGSLRLTDALVLGEGQRDHDLGRGSPHVLIRHAECIAGTVDVDVEFAPRPEYGLAHPLLHVIAGGVRTSGGPDRLVLSTDMDLTVDGGTAGGRRRLGAGEHLAFALTWSRGWDDEPAPWTADDVPARLADTVEGWRSWSSLHQAYDGPWADLVRFSGVVLQGLTFQPTGAIVAAPTTSLPEVPGGTRNWDYRYAWLRDASMTLGALWVAACPDEAGAFLSWLVGSAAADLRAGAPIQIMYGVGGEHDLHERTLDHLAGWRDSRPVRVGNGAVGQRQLDVYGEVLDAVALLRDHLTFDDATVEFLCGLADAAAAEWRDPDQGIWEVRGGPRRFLHSALMCWVALDRALDLAGELRPDPVRIDRWHHERDLIAAEILERGFDEGVGAFTQSFGSPVLDASVLRIPIVGFLPAGDPRVRATVAAIETHLTDPSGLVHRYRDDDGLPGEEGTFLLCSFWLAHAHALAGDTVRARTAFENAIAARNDLGLLAEEVLDGEMIGNFPQAFSHIGLVEAAWAIAQAEGQVAGGLRSNR